MKIECSNINEALRIVRDAEKENQGVSHPADKVILTLPNIPSEMEVDYTDAHHRFVRVWGLKEDYSTSKEWKDAEINIDSIASETISDWSCFPERDALDYMAAYSSVSKFDIHFQKAIVRAVKINVIPTHTENIADSLVEDYYIGHLIITYRDADELVKKKNSVRKWMNQHQCGRPVEIVEDK